MKKKKKRGKKCKRFGLTGKLTNTLKIINFWKATFLDHISRLLTSSDLSQWVLYQGWRSEMKKTTSVMSAIWVRKYSDQGTGENIKDTNLGLSQFEPGKISSNFTNIFSGDDTTDCEEKRPPPKKKLITLNQVFKKESNKVIWIGTL